MSKMVEKRGSPSSCNGQRYRGQRPSGVTSSSSLLTNGVVSPKGKHRRVDYQDEERESKVLSAAAFPAMHFVNSTRRNSSSRASPSKERSPKRVMLSMPPLSSPTAAAAAAALGAFFAGPKFSEPPSPASLPKPPTHWTTQTCAAAAAAAEGDPCRRFSNHLKMLLNVSA